MAQRLGEESPSGPRNDRQEPRRYQQYEPEKTGDGPHRPYPTRRTVNDREHDGREPDEHQDHRPLQQHAGGGHCPQDGRLGPADLRLRLTLARQIDARHCPHRGDAGEQQHRVGLGEARLDAEHDRARHHQCSGNCGPTANEGQRGPIRQEDGERRTGERWEAIEPDGRARLRHAERLTNLHGGGLQPIDTDRLFVANLVLKTDVDILMCFQHLLGGLREACFIAVERRNLEEARKKRDKRECHEQRRRTPVRADRVVERRSQSSRRSK
jgi:hypothetical protein